MKTRAHCRGFSLTETVIAMGLFAFCILPVLALLTVGVGSVRSVSEENSAAALAEAYFGALRVSAALGKRVQVPGLFESPQVDASARSGTMYFGGDGAQLPSAEGATLRMDYANVTQNGIRSTLAFRWPPVATTNNATQTRYFSQLISR